LFDIWPRTIKFRRAERERRPEQGEDEVFERVTTLSATDEFAGCGELTGWRLPILLLEPRRNP
jgi:hypothetical protein